MDTALYGSVLSVLCALILGILSLLAIARSWKEGQFLVLTLCLGLFFLAASALLFVLFQSVFPSVYVLGGAGFFMILSFAVVLPMTNRRGRYRTRRAR